MARISLSAATAEVTGRDPVMAALAERFGRPRLRSRRQPDAFAALARAIVYQQLAGPAASAIHARFAALFDGNLTSGAVLALPEDRLRSAGLSAAKAASIRDLASKVDDGTVPVEGFGRLSDEEIIDRFSAVRGIGRWTAQMFLIFQLGRLDVWPVDDYGVRKGYARAYRMPELPTPRALAALGEPLRPYRTVAAWYCWRANEVRAAELP